MAFWFPVWIPRTPLGWAAALLVGSVVLVVGYLAVGPDVNLPQNRNQFLIFVVIALSGGSWIGSRIERLVVERQRERVAMEKLGRLVEERLRLRDAREREHESSDAAWRRLDDSAATAGLPRPAMPRPHPLAGEDWRLHRRNMMLSRMQQLAGEVFESDGFRGLRPDALTIDFATRLAELSIDEWRSVFTAEDRQIVAGARPSSRMQFDAWFNQHGEDWANGAAQIAGAAASGAIAILYDAIPSAAEASDEPERMRWLDLLDALEGGRIRVVVGAVGAVATRDISDSVYISAMLAPFMPIPAMTQLLGSLSDTARKDSP